MCDVISDLVLKPSSPFVYGDEFVCLILCHLAFTHYKWITYLLNLYAIIIIYSNSWHNSLQLQK